MADEFGQVPIDYIQIDANGEVTFDRSSNFLGGVKKTGGGFFTPLFFTNCPEAERCILWVDEAAIPRRLPENYVVRAIFGTGAPVFGPVVVTGDADEDGNVTSVPAFLRGRIDAYFDATL